ncbi:DUF4097 domain-containing protein [Bacillus manliponensis]|uniref:DUF4097 family beta strand repeat-containing protein n=1 Tax=Bacillus manliponensis TaxID=574376 RepID=UPI0035169AD4
MKKIGMVLLLSTLLVACQDKESEQKEIDANRINEIYIQTDGQNIELESVSEEEIKIESNTLKHVKVEEKENKVVIDASKSSAGITFQTPIISIYVPEKVYNKIDVKTVSGDVKVKEIEAKMLQSKNDSGDMKVENYTGEKIEAISKAGKITLHEVNADFGIFNDTGDVSISDITEMKAKSKVETQSGNVSVNFAKEQHDIELDAWTDAGKIKHNYKPSSIIKETDTILVVKMGSGIPQLTVKSVTGAIRFGDGKEE